MTDLIDNLSNALQGLFKSNDELITLLRTPTPVKVTKRLTSDVNGCLGNGVVTPVPEVLYQCPASAEAWLHRISISSPNYTPRNPLQAGEMIAYGSGGELVFFTPLAGDICPVQLVEGHLSAPHLNGSEELLIVGDALPPNIPFRFDFQIILRTGISQYTPLAESPSDMTKATDIV